MTNTTDRPVVVGLGEILWDLLPAGKKLGGAPANFAYHAGMLGMCSYPVSCVGNDALGREILANLDELGLSSKHVASVDDFPTGTVSVELSDGGIPSYTIHGNVAWDHIPWSSALAKLAAEADAVCFGSLCQRDGHSRQTIRTFLEHTRSDCRRVFDINLRQAFYSGPIIQASLELATVLKLNDEELPVVGDLLGLSGDTVDMMRQLVERFDLELVALTRGGEGSIMVAASDHVERGGITVNIADTVGAGDAFTAAMVSGMLAGHDLQAISEGANRLGAYVASQHGGTPTLPADLKATLFNV